MNDYQETINRNPVLKKMYDLASRRFTEKEDGAVPNVLQFVVGQRPVFAQFLFVPVS